MVLSARSPAEAKVLVIGRAAPGARLFSSSNSRFGNRSRPMLHFATPAPVQLIDFLAAFSDSRNLGNGGTAWHSCRFLAAPISDKLVRKSPRGELIPCVAKCCIAERSCA